MASARDIGESLHRVFGQPAGQALPAELLRLLGELDRAHQSPEPRPRDGSK